MSTQARASLEEIRRLAGATILQLVPATEVSGRNALTIASLLQRAGARPLLAGRNGALADEWRLAGGEWMALDHDSANPIKLRTNAARLEKFIARERVDIVHAYAAGAAWSALAATEKLAVWLVTNLPETLAPRRSLRALYQTSLARGDHVIVHSSFTAAPMIERFDIPRERVTVVPNPIDAQLFDPATMRPERVLALRKAWKIPEGDRIILVPGPITESAGQQRTCRCRRIDAAGRFARRYFRAAGRCRRQSQIRARADKAHRRASREIPPARTLRRLAGGTRGVRCRCHAGDRAADFRAADSGIAGDGAAGHRVGDRNSCPRIFWRRRACRMTCAQAGWCVRPIRWHSLRRCANACRLILRPIARSRRGRGNSRNSCFRRKTLPLRSSISTRACCPGSGSGLHPLAIRTKTEGSIAAHAFSVSAPRSTLSNSRLSEVRSGPPVPRLVFLRRVNRTGFMFAADRAKVTNINPLTVLLVVPSLAGRRGRSRRDRPRAHPCCRRQPADRAFKRRAPRNGDRGFGRRIHPRRCRKQKSFRDDAQCRHHAPHPAPGTLRHHSCAWPRAGLERLHRVAPDRSSLHHVLVQGLPRAEFFQAPL